ncbi:TetR/AcrR family transcriptional regulator [Aeromicrobium duanguangcaii]|uniref:TetR family transcriptional regulator n=1 Tax=Aeromicrobium duanguangcaii TaxID=2968086 RepID=A0ABY5KBW1_9ACTN|nr:TetR/AcrR family transcriptional regulator [Aeromicrobium duanguangcaii]MCD9154780.1 TetR family transcriptional regulator [Aeromicrobium duanguangcaii]UUI67805.1 TetR family transcriptional regulator [Aeromicrobium duanguangcaii]
MTAPTDPAELRAAVWRAAGDLFARKGFGEVTIREIAALAGTSPSLVMKVAGSKEQLFHRTAAIAAPELPDVPVSALGTALVAELVDRQRRGDLEHLGRAIMLRVNAPDPQSVRTQFLHGYVTPLSEVLDGPRPELRAELAVAALMGLATTLRFFESPVLLAELDAVEAVYGPVVQRLLDGS